MRRPIIPALAMAAVLAVAACGGGTTPAPSQAASSPAGAPSAGQSAAATGTNVDIKNFAFSPATVTTTAGGKVTWKNGDSVNHTVTFDDGSVDSNNIAQNATFEHTFATAGTFAYHCKIHPNMKGTITVG
jgi:plastocyanin